MKNRVLALLLWLGLAIGVSFTNGCRRSDTRGTPNVSTFSVTIPVEGMVCGSCVARTKRALKSVNGVEEVEVSLEKRQARVRYDISKTNPDQLAASIRGLGYKPGVPIPGGK